MNETDQRQLHDAMHKIRDLVRSYCTPGPAGLWLAQRDDSPNYSYGQTSNGLFMEIYYDLPNQLWSPWGMWHLGGSGAGDWRSKLPEILRRLGADYGHPFIPVRHDTNGVYGPVWALTAIDGDPLPAPVRREREDFVSYEESEASWSHLCLLRKVDEDVKSATEQILRRGNSEP